jgi:cyclic di-GMP phosphodiesterase
VTKVMSEESSTRWSACYVAGLEKGVGDEEEPLPDEERTIPAMKGRILVEDDEETVREIIGSMLTSAGYECRMAGTPIETLDVLTSGEDFDLVCSGITEWPEEDFKRMVETFPDVPVVVSTSTHDRALMLKVLHMGAYDFLLRPFEREQLIFAVRRALEYRRLKLENRQLNHENEQSKAALSDLERSYDITLQALGDALDLKEAATEGHSKRVTAYTIAISQKMGLPKEEIRVIARGAFLHDIGKMATPEKILTKPGPLTPDEFDIMKQHPWYGYKIVKDIPFLKETAEIVYSHHERYDGTGYPRRLTGEEIPLGARIVAVAETLDSITSDLPYRPRQSFEAARKEIQLWAGRQFDPRIVEAFLNMPDNIWNDLCKDIGGRT